nr:5986_t:CDS:2 [Entrophospora candida]
MKLPTISVIILVCITQISAQVCNGYAELCSKLYSDVAHVTTHNAYAFMSPSLAANQIYDISTQLKDGVRAFMLDGNTKTPDTQNGPIELCHNNCNFLDAGLAVDTLKIYTQFLQSNPNEVITIFWENIGKHTASEYQQIYDAAGLTQFAHTQKAGDAWPTLNQMIQNGKRIVNFIDVGASPSVPWLMSEYDYVFETPFENTALDGWVCTVDRPKDQVRPMYVLNHFLSGTLTINGIKTSLPQPNSANITNGKNLETHAKNCQQTFKDIPNYVAVDFYEEQSDGVNVFSVVAGINNVQYTPKQIGNGTTKMVVETRGSGLRKKTTIANIADNNKITKKRLAPDNKNSVVESTTTKRKSPPLEKVYYNYSQIHDKLLLKASKKRAAISARYLRAEKYGKGDLLMGTSVPDIRSVSKSLGFLSYEMLKDLIQSKYHEERILAAINIVDRFKVTKDLEEKKIIFDFYINDMRQGIDNWDLVDTSASQIVGAYLFDKLDLKDQWLYKTLAISERLWDRRIAMVATQYFINKEQYEDTIKLSEIYLNDKEDLIHKATGWMLREVGKKSKKTLVNFLDKNASKMPRVMLRYSLEKFSISERKKYMNK